MYAVDSLSLYDLTVERLREPLGIDCTAPRFAWKLSSDVADTLQVSFRIVVYAGETLVADTGVVESGQSVDVVVEGFVPQPKARYVVALAVKDNHGHEAQAETWFETGLMGSVWQSRWVEPVQEPTPRSMDGVREGDAASADGLPRDAEGRRTFEEFRPAQYIRLPLKLDEGIARGRIYASAHGLYRLEVNGVTPDDRLLAPENTPVDKFLRYQTYDITDLLHAGDNVVGAVLADGWYVGRVGTTGDCCQYGDTTALIMDVDVIYSSGARMTFVADDAVATPGPVAYADLFVGERYDATRELVGWSEPEYNPDADANACWKPVKALDEPTDTLRAQAHEPVRPVRTFRPERVFTTPNGDVVIDAGQVLAGFTRIELTCEAGREIRLEHFEVLDAEGNCFNSILNINKEQTDTYVTRAGHQVWQPSFTYHGFRYVRVSGWLGMPRVSDFEIVAIASQMDDIGSFETSDARLNQLQSNIWWSQVSNTISIPTDCPQREKAGWTGDIMAYAPTLCFNRDANAFLRAWMESVRAEQLASGAVPMIVPYLKAYETFIKGNLGSDTSCGWGDAVMVVPWAIYQAYGDRRVLEENYEAMERWMAYIADRCANNHPEGYETWEPERQERDRWLWSTDFHFGDWLIPSIVLGNPDGAAMNETAYATMRFVAPAYYAFSAQMMALIARTLGKVEDADRYDELYGRIREAFIAEYVHDDATLDADFQGIYVIALRMGLVSDELQPLMVDHLCKLISANGDRLDTGFLSVLFLMDVLCDNGRSDVAYQLLYQNACPSWLYEVKMGATTMWESWGAIAEDGTVSTYSYNHYAFGCVGDWMYRTIGGLAAVEPGYKRLRIAPDIAGCGLSWTRTALETPYGRASVAWERSEDGSNAHVRVIVPPNTMAEVDLPGTEGHSLGSGVHDLFVQL